MTRHLDGEFVRRRRCKNTLIAGLEHKFPEFGSVFRGHHMRTDIVNRELLNRKWGRVRGKGLSGRSNFAGHVRFGDGPLFNRPERFARRSFEYVKKTCLTSLSYYVHRLAVMLNGYQLRRRIQIVIPEVVMDILKMPDAFDGPCVQREQTIAEKVIAQAVPTVEVISRRSRGNENDAAFHIDRH